MEIVQIYTYSPLGNFSYLILDETNKQAIVVDPHYSNQVLEWASKNEYKLHSIINTHEHNDHICGNEGLIEHITCGIHCHPNARNKISTATQSLELDSRIPWGKGWIEILDTPGHTMGHISLLVGYKDSAYCILTGDTLFNAGVGNCKKGGDLNSLYHSVTKKIGSLPDSVKVFPGHDYWENNLRFTLAIDPMNHRAIELLGEYQSELKKGRFLVSNLGIEKEISLFYRTHLHNDWKGELWTSRFNPSDSGSSESRPSFESIFKNLRSLRDSW